MDLATRKKRLRQTGLWCSLEISGAGFVVVFFVLLIFMMASQPIVCGGNSINLAPTPHAGKLPGILREDALVIAVMRDGTYYLGSNRVLPDQIVAHLAEGIAAGSERKVYIKADARSKYGAVAAAIDAVHEVGIEQVGLVTLRPQDVVEP